MIPSALKTPVRRLRQWIQGTPSPPVETRFCPICEKGAVAFASYNQRSDALCPNCHSLERHRYFWLFLKRKTDFWEKRERKMLHIAPERFFAPRFQDHIGSGYLTADLLDPNVMVKMDITDIQYPDNTFDIVYCSHVLEHVPDDRKAMREFRRVLKPSGWAILLVPITADKTDEDPTLTDPAERLRRFGQDDHVRVYGPDYIDRLRESGFQVKHFRPNDIATADEIVRFSITVENRSTNDIFYCTK